MARFEANQFPLTPGLRLLEASAGTGKTFALAHLVLRMVGEQGWSLRELLVVTYTEAAAAELRDRIGQRLQHTLALLEHPHRSAPDPVLEQWLAATASPSLRGRLLLALEELDAADITTLHGFCRRTLQRQSLEAGRSPELRLETSAEELLAEVVHAYWQRQLMPLPLPLLAGLQAARVSPELLRRLLGQLDGDPALALDPLPADQGVDSPLPDWLPALWRERWQVFRLHWCRSGAALQSDLQAMAAAWRDAGAGDSGVYRPTGRSDRAAAVSAWLEQQPEGGDYEAVRQQALLTGFFHPGDVARVARRLEGDDRPLRLPQEPLLRAIADLVDGPAEAVLRHACHWGRAELRRRRLRRGLTSFSQLLADLDPGPDEAVPSPLLEAVGLRYRAALVDEFQDTDPIQWRILRRAFGQGRHPLVMVGDPKQAIYRFRGGDLGTYLAARQQAQERFELQENRRSTPALLAALNTLMQPGLGRSGLEVPAVEARSARTGPEGSPLELLWLDPSSCSGAEGMASADGVPSRTALEALVPGWIAAELERLLASGAQLAEGGAARPLVADDCCLLVSTHQQAEALRAALEARRIPSRLVSRADVFASPAATALQRFLDALADPADGNRLRLLATSSLLGWSAADLAATGPLGWSRLAAQVEQLAQALPRRGLLGVLADLLGPLSLARLALGGRQLADLQQVAELVQTRIHADQLGVGAAADWLRRLRLAEDRLVPEEHQAHSDRSDGAVSVVTIHRSKGLEYPVVICPFLWQAAGSSRSAQTIGRRWQPRPGAAPLLDLHLHPHTEAGWPATRQQRRAEEEERERLAYVALTRACHRLILAWGPARDQQTSPLVPWLFPDQGLPDADHDSLASTPASLWRQRLEEGVVARGLALRLLDPQPAASASEPASELAAALASAIAPVAADLATGPVPLRPLDRRWGRSSYTSWTQASHGASAEALEVGRDTADSSALEEEALPAAPALEWPERGPLAGFPRGATAGDCLHRILERVDLEGGFHLPASRETAEQELRRAGLGAEPLDPLLEGLERMRLTPFGGALGHRRVADLAAGCRLHELRFDLSLRHVRASELAAAFANHPGGCFGAEYAAQLAELPIDCRGFLTGSIDLVFRLDASPLTPGDEEAGRWWVADWKSNWLGRRVDPAESVAAADPEATGDACGPRHYDQSAMARLMARSHYPLQAHLYLVALHRYLQWRLPGYQAERHLGGYAYVFLRGTPGPSGARALPGSVPGMLVERPPLERLLALDQALGRPSGGPL